MANLHQLLKAMIDKGASDLHVTTGSPPAISPPILTSRSMAMRM